MTAVRFQLGLTGASGADAAALSGQAGTHAGQPGQQILVLCQLHLKPALPGLGPLGENIQDQCAAVQHGDPDDFLQGPDISRGKLVVKYHHIRFGGLHQHFHLQSLSLTNEGMGIRGVAVLQNFAGTEAAGSLQQVLQLVQGCLGGNLFLGKAAGVQSHQNSTFDSLSLGNRFHFRFLLFFGKVAVWSARRNRIYFLTVYHKTPPGNNPFLVENCK